MKKAPLKTCLNIVLVEPEIPQNTGNIGRTCMAMNAALHLIEPLGFSIEDKYLRRAGMDYWKNLNVQSYKNFNEFLEKNPDGQKVYLSQKAPQRCDRFVFEDQVYLIFGKESKGLEESLIKANLKNAVRVPMMQDARSLNLANAVAVLCYEVMRQKNFDEMITSGILTDQDAGCY